MTETLENPKFRTEDLKPDEIKLLFVETSADREIITLLKAASPVVLEGSRGTGKSFLMKVAEIELDESFVTTRVLPVYLSFTKSSLVHTPDSGQFYSWMMAKLCARILRILKQKGFILPVNPAISLLAGGDVTSDLTHPTRLEDIAEQYEESFQKPEKSIDARAVPSVDDFRDAIEDICRVHNIGRICILFDEAVHIFRPEQQRQFFTLFRDLRSPYISCNAAVYPGVTSYGPVFELAHDATLLRIERDVLNLKYVETMREIVLRQADSHGKDNIIRNGETFAVLAYAVSGNPRLLIKTWALSSSLKSRDVDEAIKSFYRSSIWTEHSSLGQSFAGHRSLIDWGRTFVETYVLPETKNKNDRRLSEGVSESTAYFWIHRDAPERVTQALRLLAYTGIVQKGDEAIRGTRHGLGTRYMVNLGCLFALERNPASTALEIARNLSIKRFTEFGANHPAYEHLAAITGNLEDEDTLDVLNAHLSQSVEHLDVSQWQCQRLKEAGMTTIGDVLKAPENELVNKLYYVGSVRARRIKNAANAAVLEYLSG